ncbi:MAG: ChbG/HpnK family deacetylase [Chloroflexi bacterium]|nr:ChbG/HpnK family deacetylase [Chloroflexota bacterium]
MEAFVVVHVDDLGMSRPANLGGVEAMEGAATCGSIMVPCPGFAEMVEIARERPELDVGCHITLNNEFPGFGWGPVLDDVPSLCGPDGNLWPDPGDTVAHADPEEVRREMRAQLELLLETGIDVTHIDSHCGTAWDQAFYREYIELGLEFDIPVLTLPVNIPAEDLASAGLRIDPDLNREMEHAVAELGFPVFDLVEVDTPNYDHMEAEQHHLRRIDRLVEGSNYFVLHSALGGPELRAIAPNCPQRDAERYLFAPGGALEGEIASRGIATTGMRELRDRARAERTR